MGKYSNAFFSETTNMIKAKLYMNVHWMVLYNLKVFCSSLVSEKKSFEISANQSILLALAAILNIRLEQKTVTMKFKMAATAGLNLTLDPMGKMFQNASSLKPLGQLKPNCPGMIIGYRGPSNEHSCTVWL
jgi:hypothetical protein